MTRVSHTLDGDKLVRLRAQRGLSQEQLAADADVSKRTVERAEAGHRISGMNCARLATALGVSLSDLLEGKPATLGGAAQPTSTRRSARRAALIVAPIAIIAAALILGHVMHPTALDDRRVAVFPLHVLGEESDDYVGRAFAEAISVNLLETELSIAPFAADDAPAEPIERQRRVARDAGARYAVSGTLFRSGDRVEVQLVLRDTRDGQTVWGTTAEDTNERLTRLATRVTRELAAALGAQGPPHYDYWPHLGGSVEMTQSTELVETYAALARGDFEAFREWTRRLVRRFPDQADAHALRAYGVFGAHATGYASRDDLERALTEAERVDPRHPTAQCIRAELLKRENELDDAIGRASEISVRQDLTPAARAWALRIRAAAEVKQAQLNAARYDVQQALRLDPTNHFNHSAMGRILAAEGDTAAALAAHRRSMTLVPHDWGNYFLMTRLLVAQGRWVEAAPYAAKWCSMTNDCGACAEHARALARAGLGADAIRAAGAAGARCDSLGDASPFTAYVLAEAWALSGRLGAARAALAEAVARGFDPALADSHLFARLRAR